ncbi:MAG: hypothetical protein ABWX83_07285, partial [Luteibacter sp.]
DVVANDRVVRRDEAPELLAAGPVPDLDALLADDVGRVDRATLEPPVRTAARAGERPATMLTELMNRARQSILVVPAS